MVLHPRRPPHSISRPRSTRLLPPVALSEGYRPRSSPAAARAPHPELDRDDAPPLDCRTGQNAPAMSMLFSADDKASAAENFLMQYDYRPYLMPGANEISALT
jgi:hypothetical protein